MGVYTYTMVERRRSAADAWEACGQEAECLYDSYDLLEGVGALATDASLRVLQEIEIQTGNPFRPMAASESEWTARLVEEKVDSESRLYWPVRSMLAQQSLGYQARVLYWFD